MNVCVRVCVLVIQSLEQQLESNSSGTNDNLPRIRSQLDHVIAQRTVDSTRHASDVDEKSREIERLKLKMAELEKTNYTVTVCTQQNHVSYDWDLFDLL